MEALDLFQKAPSRKIIQEICVLCWNNRKSAITDAEIATVVELMNKQIDAAQATKLIEAVREVVMESIYYSMDSSDLGNYVGEIHPKIKETIAKIVQHYTPEWRESAVKNLVSLPRLQNIDWRIDIKNSSDHLARMSVPSIIVQLQVEETPTKVGQQTGTRNINFELTKEALEVMLEELSQIKKQLDSI